MKRLLFLDYTRGLAALSVFFSHSLEHFAIGWTVFGNSVLNLGQVGVVMFFLVSGFVIPISLENKGSQPKFWLSRIFRIYPLYIFIFLCSVTLILLGLVPENAAFLDKPLQNIAYHTVFVQSFLPAAKFGAVDIVPGSWTLFIELIWYVFFSLLFLFKFNKHAIKVAFLVNLCIILAAAASWILHKRVPMGLLCFFNLCVLGFIYNRFFHARISLQTLSITALGTYLVNMVALYVAFGVHKSDLFTVECVLISWSLGFVLFNLLFFGERMVKGLLSKILEYLGQISYSLYLVHGTLLYIVHQPIGLGGWEILVHLVLSVGISHLTFKYIEEKGVLWGRRVISNTITH